MRIERTVLIVAAILLPLSIFLLLPSGLIVHAGGGYTAGIALSNQTVSIPATVARCNVPCGPGVYRVSLSCMTTAVGKGSVSIAFSWSNFGNIQTQTSGSCDLKTLGSNTGSLGVIYLDGATPPIYSATVGSPGPAGAAWRGNIVLEQLQ